MRYKQVIEWLNSYSKYGVKPGLNRIKKICESLDNPQDDYRIIHVGGTNGKGSVCNYISSVLTKCGYKTGLYISPHLKRFTERMKINGLEIKKNELVKIVEKIKPVVEKNSKNGDPPTYFEIVTAIGFLYFSKKKVDFAVIEVGLGGKYDATNIVKPDISVITNISLEHQDILGKDIKDIAYEKAGIIKKQIPVITGATDRSLEIIEKIARENNSDIIVLKDTSWERIDNDLSGQKFKIKGFLKNYDIKTKMLGKFQGKNIALSLLSLEKLQMEGVFIPEDCLNKGFGQTFFPGRMEVLNKKPIIIADGAHNIEGIKFLKYSLEKDFSYDRLIFVLGILSDKKIFEMVKILIPLADVIIATKSSNKRSCEPLDLKKIIIDSGFKKEVIIKDTIENAVNHARSVARKDDLICITGSLFTVGESKKLL